MHSLAAASREGHIEVTAAVVARFYGEGLCWALGLTLPVLLRWHGLIDRVRAADPMGAAVWIRRPPER